MSDLRHRPIGWLYRHPAAQGNLLSAELDAAIKDAALLVKGYD